MLHLQLWSRKLPCNLDVPSKPLNSRQVPKKNTSNYLTSQAFSQETPSTSASYRKYPLPPGFQLAIEESTFFGWNSRSFPKKCQLPTFPYVVFLDPWKKDAPQTPWISPLVVKTSRNCSHNDNIDNSASGAVWEVFFGGFGVREFQKKWREKNERTQMDRKWTLYCFLLNQTVTIES